MKRCRICSGTVTPFISFGRMPIANGFLSPDAYADETFFELAVGFCPDCGMVQLLEQVDPEQMFHDHYAFYSSTSAGMSMHFKELAERIMRDHASSPDPFIIEIGSNDGITLQHIAGAGMRHLGVEPSRNVAQVAIDKGIQTWCEFFDEALAHRILAEHGQADVFLGSNVMCHIPDLCAVFSGVKLLLKPNGVLIFEDPYLGDIVEKTSYDQMYDEHVFYFSLKSITALAEQHGLEVVDVAPQNVHGGSMRYIIAHKGARPVAPAVAAQREKEAALGLHRPETFDQFRRNIEGSRDALVALLKAIKQKGKRVVGYGATSKSTTVTNYCGIGPELVEFISDTTPIKQGTFSPGAHIPVRPYEAFTADYPDYALLFAWNHATEIMAKEEAFKAAGGKWIVYVPDVEVR